MIYQIEYTIIWCSPTSKQYVITLGVIAVWIPFDIVNGSFCLKNIDNSIILFVVTEAGFISYFSKIVVLDAVVLTKSKCIGVVTWIKKTPFFVILHYNLTFTFVLSLSDVIKNNLVNSHTANQPLINKFGTDSV